MHRAIDTALRRLEELWAGIASLVGGAVSHLELWHVCLFIIGLWLLAKLTGPRFYGR